MAERGPRRRRGARRRYLLGALALALAVLALGWRLDAWLTEPAAVPDSGHTAEYAGEGDFDRVFESAVARMRQGRYRDALALWHRALLIDDAIPEVKVNLGFTLFELGEYRAARDMFIAAMEQNAFQANAYYGLAITSEKMGDLEGALGAMRSYVHLGADEKDEDYLRRARAAMWEWEAQLAADRPGAADPGAAAQSSAPSR